MTATTVTTAPTTEHIDALKEAFAKAKANVAPHAQHRVERLRRVANDEARRGRLTDATVLGYIRLLESFPVTGASVQVQPRTNAYAQACQRCGQMIEAGKGLLERSEGSWIVSHPEGECPVVLLEGIPEGRYAIDWASEDGPERIDFYQLFGGKLYAQASDELHPIIETAHMAKVLDAIKADPRGASLLYGIKLGACGVCGRTLTNQESRDLGIGPVCRQRMGW